MIAGDGALNFQSKSADYYQSSRVIINRELDFKNSRVYQFGFSRSLEKASFSFFILYKSVKEVLSFQTQIILKNHKNLHQKINSFIKQAVFVNEVITSGNFKKSLYTA